MVLAGIHEFIIDKSHSLIASFTGAATTTALSWSLDLLSRCLVGLIVGVGTWLITHAISAGLDTARKNSKTADTNSQTANTNSDTSKRNETTSKRNEDNSKKS